MDVNIDNQAVEFQMTQVCEGNNVFVYVLGLLFPIGISPKECKSQWIQQIRWTQHDPCTKKHGHNVICASTSCHEQIVFIQGPGPPILES